MSYYLKEIQNISENNYLRQVVQDKKFLVTGASGLIGSYVCDLLLYSGAYVCAVVRSDYKPIIRSDKFSLLKTDITALNTDSVTAVDYIVHAASPANPKAFDEDPVGVINANFYGTSKMLEIARKFGAKLLITSSSEVYGENNLNRAMKEDDYCPVNCLSPRSCYTESKRLAENMCISYDKQYGTRSVIARIAFCYGGNFSKKDNRVVPQFIRMATEDKHIVMQSSGAMKRSYIYVADVAVAIIKLLTTEFTGAINLANDDSVVSIRQLAEAVCELTGANFEIDKKYLNNAQGVSPFTNGILDGSKLREEGIVPQFDINAGLKSSVCIYKERNREA